MTELKNKKKYYKTIFTFVLLSEDPIPDGLSLSDLEYECDQGADVGFFDAQKDETLNGKQMADALAEAGSDTGFFNLTDEGEQAEDTDNVE